MSDEYNKFKKRYEGKFFIPPEHILRFEEANTNHYLRVWFAEKVEQYTSGKTPKDKRK